MQIGCAQFLIASCFDQTILLVEAAGEGTTPLRVIPIDVSLECPEATPRLPIAGCREVKVE